VNAALQLFSCLAAAVLALAVDQLLALIETGLRHRSRVRVALGGIGIAALVAATLVPSFARSPSSYIVGAKTFAEQYVLSALIAQRLRAAELTASSREGLGSNVIYDALSSATRTRQGAEEVKASEARSRKRERTKQGSDDVINFHEATSGRASPAPAWSRSMPFRQGSHFLSGAAGVMGPLLASTPLKTLCFTASISFSDNTPSPSVSPRTINIRMKNAES
jgi:hypothetical protein